MSGTLIAVLAAGGGVIVALGIIYATWRFGYSAGGSAQSADQASNDLQKQRRADAIVMTETTPDALQKSLRDGTF